MTPEGIGSWTRKCFLNVYLNVFAAACSPERTLHSYIVSENLLIRFGKGNLPCLQCNVKALAMPSFWPEGIDNAFILSKNQCECLPFWPEGIANAFLFTLDGKFSLTIGMIMPLGWGEVTGIIPKLVTQGPFWFPTCHSWLRHLWLVGNPNGLSWLVGNYFFPFTRGKPLVKGKSPCLCLSLKALRQCHAVSNNGSSIAILDRSRGD